MKNCYNCCVILFENMDEPGQTQILRNSKKFQVLLVFVIVMLVFVFIDRNLQGNINSISSPSLLPSSLSFLTKDDNKISTLTASSSSPPPPRPSPNFTTLPPGSKYASSLPLAPPIIPQKSLQLLVITKGRSGSTFTSSLIHRSPRVFYTFEPLHVFKALKLTDAKQDVATKLVRAFLTCDFTKVRASMLNENFIGRSGPIERHFIECEREKQYGFAHIQCWMDVINHCLEKDVTFSKLIRFPLSWAERLLRELPNLKIVYLIRDPRAVVHSQAKVFKGHKWPQDTGEHSSTHCSEIRDDIAAFFKLKKLFPGRLKAIRYEQGAMNPIQYAKELYAFAGLEYTTKTEGFIQYLQNPTNNESNDNYSIRRSDGAAVVSKWRHSVGAYEAAMEVDINCRDVYQMAGYLKVSSKEHLLSNASLIIDNAPILQEHYEYKSKTKYLTRLL